MASIEDIPDEIISQIFQIGPIQLRKKRRKCLLLVSKKWGKLADSSLGLEIFIGASPWEGWESTVDIDHVNINRIQDFGVSNCHIGELLEIDWDTARSSSNGLFGLLWNMLDKVRMLLTSPPFPKFKHPHLLSKFRFSGLIRNNYFQNLITPATTYHLRQLQFNHSAIILLESKSLQQLDLENLNYLEVMADFTYLFRNPQELDLDDAMIVDNILALLQNRFPKLKACKLYIPFTSAREMEISKIIFSFLNRHAAHLRSLEICYFLMLAEDGDEGLPAGAGDDDLSLTQQGNTEIDQLVNGTLDQLQLRVAILHLDSDKLRCFNHWSRLLSRQRELEYLHAVSERQIFSASLITQLSNTLRVMKATVSIRSEQGQPTPLDCTIFSNCSKLTHFTIKGIFEEYVVMRTSPGLINSEFLPQTIQHMDLTRIPVLSSELKFILLNLPQLRHFAGKYLGRSGGMGVTVELLKEVIQTRQLEWFLLDASVNGDFPEHGLSNGNPIRPLFLISDNDYICAKLDSDGYYVNASPFEELLANLRISPIHLNSETDTN